MAIEDSSEAAVRPGPHRPRVTSQVFDALTAVVPGQQVEALDERQELYADLGLDSLRFVRLLDELASRFHLDLDDEELMEVELVTVADLVDLVERISLRAAD